MIDNSPKPFFDEGVSKPRKKIEPISNNIEEKVTNQEVRQKSIESNLREMKNVRVYPVARNSIAKRIPIGRSDWYALKQIELFVAENRADMKSPKADLTRVTAGSLVETIVSEFMKKLEEKRGDSWADNFPNATSVEDIQQWVRTILN